jgi:hypothetical protein
MIKAVSVTKENRTVMKESKQNEKNIDYKTTKEEK